jgi:hypothetical protein
LANSIVASVMSMPHSRSFLISRLCLYSRFSLRSYFFAVFTLLELLRVFRLTGERTGVSFKPSA